MSQMDLSRSRVGIIAFMALLHVGCSRKGAGSQSTDSKQQVIPLPTDLRHPNTLSPVVQDSFDSLLEHGQALAEYGAQLSVYARPACEAAAHFKCYDTPESSQESLESWLPRAIEYLHKATTLRPTDLSAYLLLINAHLSSLNLSAALDLYENHVRDGAAIAGWNDAFANRAHVLVRVHVLATRNCWWTEIGRAHRLMEELLAFPNVTIPAMHMVELPRVTADQFLRNMQGLNRGIEADLAPDLAKFQPKIVESAGSPKRKTKKKKKKKQTDSSQRLTLGYVSPTGFVSSTSSRALLGVFLARSRHLFRVICYAGERDDGSQPRALIRENCDSFVEVAGWSPARLAAQVREDEVDILVDVLGFASGAALAGLPAFRQAPLQVNFHGQPFSTGHVDYYVSDRVSSPPEHQGHYTEKMILLPDFYLCNDLPSSLPDFWQQPPPKHVTRAMHRLKARDVLLANFGQPHKIHPELFACWLRVLRRCPTAKLWLFRFPLQGYGGADVAGALRAEAARAGINASRVVVSELFPKEVEHAHKRLADVFLDTAPFSAHTTMADALWAGLPAVVWPGERQPSRVGAALVAAAGGAGVVVRSLEEYEEVLVQLVRKRERRQRIRARLEATLREGPGAKNGPIWDMTAYQVAYEAGLRMAWDTGRAEGLAGRKHVIVNSQTRNRILRLHGIL